MENASKALIIAGAILISIVLVSVGVLVVQQLNPSDALDSMSAQEIQAFNSKFESNIGTNKTGTVVKSLLSTIATHNAQTDDTNKQIKVSKGTYSNGSFTAGDAVFTPAAGADTNSISTYRAGISSSKRYDIGSVTSKSGQIIEIIICERTN